MDKKILHRLIVLSAVLVGIVLLSTSFNATGTGNAQKQDLNVSKSDCLKNTKQKVTMAGMGMGTGAVVASNDKTFIGNACA